MWHALSSVRCSACRLLSVSLCGTGGSVGRSERVREAVRSLQTEQSPAKAEADRTGAERRERSDRRGDGAAGPSGPDRGGGSADRREARGASEGGSEGIGRAGGPWAGGPGTSGGGGEAVPSAGWREVAAALDAGDGVGHE
jgi:hypothetical protein